MDRVASMLVGSTFSPLARTMISLARPVMTSSPVRVSLPKSPVRRKPSGVKAEALASGLL
ncbi:hypothetical protein DSECCO2_388070 [anaerobic digester metagenome]